MTRFPRGSRLRVVFLAMGALLWLSETAIATGFQRITVPAEGENPAIEGAVWSPCAAPPGEIKVGSVTLSAAENCPIAGEGLPLVVISHGYGGSYLGHRDTAEALAEAGFVAIAISHPVDSGRGGMLRADTLAVLVDRPADIKRTIDFMLGAWPDHARLDAQRIGFFGFSRGGYTGLVIAGGNPDIRKADAFCAVPFPKPSCEQLRKSELPKEGPVHDPRVKAAVLADPGSAPLFDRVALKGVKIPLQLWASERSSEDMTGAEVKFEWVNAIADELPVKPDYHLVPNAGHFAFLPPCTPEGAKSFPRGCVDRPGFDRAAFHKELNAAVAAFLREHLAGAR
jgi:predicted dienelactone hydrolase